MQEAAKQQATEQEVTAQQQRQLLAMAAAQAAQKQNNVQTQNPVAQAQNLQKSTQISHTGNPIKTAPLNEEKKTVQPDIPENRYIPSPEGVKIKDANKKDDALEKALARVDRMEKEAYKTLGGR